MSKQNSGILEKVKLVIIIVSVILVFVLGVLGFKETTGDDFNLFGAIYSTICLFLMGNADPVVGSIYILIAQYLAAILFSLGIFSLVFDQVQNAFIVSKIRLRYRDHIVVFSLNSIGHKIANELLSKGYRVVVVENDKENGFIHQVKEKNGLVIIGNGTDGKSISNAGVAFAKTCIIAGDDDKENMEIVNEILFYREKKNTRESIKILLHITDNNNMNVLKDYLDIHNEDEDYDLETFNISQLAAKKIYDRYPPHLYINPDQDEECIITVIGYTQAAEEFLLENIILSHYPELKNLKIYLVDKDADLHFNDFCYKYPFYAEFIDIIPVKLHNSSFYANFAVSKKHIEKISKSSIIYMFGESDAGLLTSSANLRQFFYNQTSSLSQTPIVICLPEDAGITELLNSNRDPKKNATIVFSKKLNIQLYHMVSDSCTSESILEHTELIDKLSKVINYYYSMKYEFSHELKDRWEIGASAELISRAEKVLLDMPDEEETINIKTIQKRLIRFLSDETGVHYNSLYSRLSVEKRWNILSHRKKDSNRYAARQLNLKFTTLKRVGCDPLTNENIVRYYARLAPMEHKRWSGEKMVFNYKYGVLVSDKHDRYIQKEILKIHDQLIPYEQLTDIEKEKDLTLFLLLPLLSKISSKN